MPRIVVIVLACTPVWGFGFDAMSSFEPRSGE